MLAVMVAVPVAAVVAIPLELIVAMFAFEEFQLACVVRSSVLPSLNVPTASNCCEPPNATLGSLGVMLIPVSEAFVTVNDAVPAVPPNNAVIVVMPGEIPVANPPAASLTVATAGDDDAHDAEFVRFCIVPSANVPIA